MKEWLFWNVNHVSGQRTEWPPLFSHPRWPAPGQDSPFLALHTARGAKVAAEATHARVRMAMMLFILMGKAWWKKWFDDELKR